MKWGNEFMKSTLTCKVIGMNSIFYELAESVLVYVNAASLSVMNIAFNNCRIGTGFHFKSGNSIIMDVIFLEITLRKNKNEQSSQPGKLNDATYHSIIEREYADVASMMYMIFPHYRTGEILHPNAGQCIATDLVVFVCALCIIGNVQADILAVANIAVSYNWIRTNSTNANGSSN